MKLYTVFSIVLLMGVCSMNAQTLVSGKATLEKKEKDLYTITKDDGISKMINLERENQNTIPGLLSVLFNDCNEVRSKISDNYPEGIDEKKLVNFVNTYNQCTYSNTYVPTEKEIVSAANYQEDMYHFYGGPMAALQRISFFEDDTSESLIQAGFGVGVIGTPGFLGNLQGNVFFTLEGTMAFSSDTDFGNAPFDANFKFNTYQLAFGMEYHFNKKGSFQPFLGFGGGISQDHYKGTYNGFTFDKGRGGSGFYTPSAGVLFNLKNGKSIGLKVSYISEYKNEDLHIFTPTEIIPLSISNSAIKAGLNFYF